MDGLEHLDDRLVGAAVQGAPQGVDAGGDGGVEVAAGAAHQPDRRGRAVLLVVGVEDEQLVEYRHHLGQDDVRPHRRVEHHVEEVAAVGQVVARVDERLADGFLVGKGGDGTDLGDEPAGGHVDVFQRIVAHLRVEVVQAVDHHRQDGHGRGVGRELVEEMDHVLVDEGMLFEQGAETLQFLAVGQLVVQEQVGHLDEQAARGQVLDGVAAVQEQPLVAVQVGDRAAAGGGVLVAGVEHGVAGVLQEAADVDGPVALHPFDDRQLVASPVDDQFRRTGLVGVRHAVRSLSMRVCAGADSAPVRGAARCAGAVRGRGKGVRRSGSSGRLSRHRRGGAGPRAAAAGSATRSPHLPYLIVKFNNGLYRSAWRRAGRGPTPGGRPATATCIKEQSARSETTRNAR